MSAPRPRSAVLLAATLIALLQAPRAAAQAPEPEGSAQAPASPAAEEISGGAHLVLLESPELGRTDRLEGLLLFDVGAVHEPAGRTGLLMVLAAALRSGVPTRPSC